MLEVDGQMLTVTSAVLLSECFIGSGLGSGSVSILDGTVVFTGSGVSLNIGGAGPGEVTIMEGTLDNSQGLVAVGGTFVSQAGGVLTLDGPLGSVFASDMLVGGMTAAAPGEIVIRPTADGLGGLEPITVLNSLMFSAVASSTLTVDPQYPVQIGDSWVLFSTAAPATGTFDTVNFPSGIAGTVDYQPNQVVVTITGVPIANDDCANAIALPSTFAVTPYDATGATTDGSDAMGFCDYGMFGDEINHNDIWFTYTPDIGGCTYISTQGLAGYDTRLTVYDTPNCPDDPATVIACVDDEQIPTQFPFEAGLDVNLQAGVTYLIRLGTFDAGTAPGTGSIRIAGGPQANVLSGGMNPGAPGCVDFPSWCNGDGGDQVGCTDCPCGNNAVAGSVGGCAHSASAGNGGLGSLLLAEGSASISLPSGSTTDLRLSMENMPPVSTTVMFSGAAIAPQNMANPCFGKGVAVMLGASGEKDGLRCAVGGLVRHGNRQSDASGEIKDDTGPSRTWGGVAGPAAGLGVQAGFMAGQTRYFQATHRDLDTEQCMTGLNTSQAIEVTFTP